ncbi:MAG TPA: Holliday junction branch migration protein RuvA [Candidatus Udaeobacter sp.]|nr:Holliday junction branch migration protein RuvA [Candidatus Udaeobacter sp.]
MIAKLTGLLDQAGSDSAVIDVGGVGYLVFCSARSLARMPAKGAPVSLLIETHVREDHIHLYGFAEPAERDWFRLLTTVQGVGAKLALALLGVLAPEDLMRAIAAADKASLARAPGVGQKLAQRIATELKDKVRAVALGPAAADLPQRGSEADAVSALVNLGYRRAEAFDAVIEAARRLGASAPVDALIRAGLKELSQ